MATSPTEIPDALNQVVITPPTTNGSAPGPRMLKREKWARLPGDYSEFEFRFWVNHPVALMTTVKTGDPDEQKEALCKIVLEHNGWLDFEGKPYPLASDPAFWDEIPDEVAAAILATVDAEKSALPNSARTMRRR